MEGESEDDISGCRSIRYGLLEFRNLGSTDCCENMDRVIMESCYINYKDSQNEVKDNINNDTDYDILTIRLVLYNRKE